MPTCLALNRLKSVSESMKPRTIAIWTVSFLRLTDFRLHDGYCSTGAGRRQRLPECDCFPSHLASPLLERECHRCEVPFQDVECRRRTSIDTNSEAKGTFLTMKMLHRLQRMVGPPAGLLVLVLTVSAFACGEPDPSDDPSPETGPSPTAGRPSAADEPPTPGLPPTAVSATTPETDREALVALYNATDGPNWSNNANWLSDRPIGEWEGVTTSADGRVTNLFLESNGLLGEISPELGGLTSLEALSLRNNLLSGNIPPELSRLTDLEALSLSNNQLSGNTPPELDQLTNLEVLGLGINRLGGRLPPELGNLSNLALLRLESNQGVGEIPPELGNLSNLRAMGVADNRLTGCVPASLHDNLTKYRLDNYDLGNLPFCGIDATPTPDPANVRVAIPVSTPITGPTPAPRKTGTPHVPAPTAAPRVAAVPVATVLGSTAVPVATTPAEATASVFRIGVMQPLTGPGESYGTLILQAKQMAVDEINSAGGINGRLPELVVENSQCNAEAATAAYNLLTTAEGVKIILGTTCNGPLQRVATLGERDGVVLFSASAARPDISNAGDYVFRTTLSDVQIGTDIGNVMWNDGVRSLATISEATTHADTLRGGAVTHFQQLGGQLVAKERFSAKLDNLLSASPDGLFVAGVYEVAIGSILNQVREMGYEGPIYSETLAVG